MYSNENMTKSFTSEEGCEQSMQQTDRHGAAGQGRMAWVVARRVGAKGQRISVGCRGKSWLARK